MLSVNAIKTSVGECNDFWKGIKALKAEKESLSLTVGGTSGESNIANLWKDNFSAIANTVPGDDVIKVHELRKIVTGLKIRRLWEMFVFHLRL